MVESIQETVDPRIRRTRQWLQEALVKLLEKKEFEKISVQDIADTAAVNRATFYDHYTDKFALLDAMVAIRFSELLAKRQVSFDGSCPSALTGMVLAVCDYLTPGKSCPKLRQVEPRLECAVVEVVRRMILEGLQQQGASAQGVSLEMIAATLSWAVYGAAKEWVRTPDRCTSEEIAGTVVRLVSPFLSLLTSTRQVGGQSGTRTTEL